MQGTTVARNYAEALLELARGEDRVEVYAERLMQVVEWAESEREFKLFLETPRITPAEKKRVLDEVLGDQIPELLLRFLFVVIDKGRQRLLRPIADEYAELVNEHFGRLRVQITTAREPDEEFATELKNRLGALFDKEILPLYRVDPRILGGVVVRVGDRVMDGSLRRRLQGLRRSLLRQENGTKSQSNPSR